MNKRIALCKMVAAAVAATLFHCAHAEVLTGPFVPNSGSYDLVPNGGFENGLDGWVNGAPSAVTFLQSNAQLFAGSFSIVAFPANSCTACGFALHRQVSLTAGHKYVLSGFIYTGEFTSGHAYLDLNDVPWDVQPYAPPTVLQWQFVFEPFTAGVGAADTRVRLVMDGELSENSKVYFDQVAITPFEKFVPPTPTSTRLDIQLVPMLKLTGPVGTTNQIQYTTDIGQTNGWITLTNIVLAQSPEYIVDTSAAGAWNRYYQAVVTGGSSTNSPPPDANTPGGMVAIPAGSFEMGDTFKEGGATEQPVHTVYVSGFYMDQTGVTKALWDEVYQWAIRNGYSFDFPGSGKGPTHPVHTINWFDAVKWCNARAEKAGMIVAYYTDATLTKVYRTGRLDFRNEWVKWDAGYRLPTEAEWEKAARGGAIGHRFPWTDTDAITHVRANYYSTNFSGSPLYSYDLSPTQGYNPTYATSPMPYTSPVGSFAPNAYGLHDMAGNLSEWCWDRQGWDSGVVYPTSPQTDPRGNSAPDNPKHAIRGGSWQVTAPYCRTAARAFLEADFGPGEIRTTSWSVGFRCVLPQHP